MLINNLQIQETASTVNVSFNIQIENNRRTEFPNRLSYEVPLRFSDFINEDSYDAPLMAILPLAMHLKEDLNIKGGVNRTLFDNALLLHDILAEQFPDFLSRINLRCNTLNEDSSERGKGFSAAAFSGGVDSTYTFLSHFSGKSRISYGIFIDGFDIPLGDGKYEYLYGKYKSFLEEYNAGLVKVRTNIKEFVPKPVGVYWSFMHLGMLSSVPALLSKGIHTFYYPAHKTFKELLQGRLSQKDKNASMILQQGYLDAMLYSSKGMQVFPDGINKTRLEKIRFISSFAQTYTMLRVCWREENAGYTNCSTCSKCLDTMALLHQAGVLEKYSTFNPGTLQPKKLSFMIIPKDREYLVYTKKIPWIILNSNGKINIILSAAASIYNFRLNLLQLVETIRSRNLILRI